MGSVCTRFVTVRTLGHIEEHEGLAAALSNTSMTRGLICTGIAMSVTAKRETPRPPGSLVGSIRSAPKAVGKASVVESANTEPPAPQVEGTDSDGTDQAGQLKMEDCIIRMHL